MKNKKNIVMYIIIAVLAIALVIMGICLVIQKKKLNDQSAGTAGETTKTEDSENVDENDSDDGENKSADNEDTSDSDTSSDVPDNGSIYLAEISHDNSWEADGKTWATENIVVYNNSDESVSDWKIEITYKSAVDIDQIWGGEEQVTGEKVSVSPVDYNQEIAAGGSVNLGYNFYGDDLEVADYTLYINGEAYKGSVMKKVIDSSEALSSEEATTEKVSKSAVVEKGTPFDNHGKLSVKGTDIVDKNGDKYQLKGTSTHGITWFPDYVNKDAFETIRDDWGANLVRLAMYTDTGDSYGYCSGGDKEEILALLDEGVSAATELGMYVIVDWHILNDNNPNTHIDDAKEFFATVSKKYSKNENVIYEICNEPNGGTTWSDVKKYAETVIPVIRENDEDAIIIVGTPNWSQDVDEVAKDPITGYDNIMYAVHFYAATHKEDLRNKLVSAEEAGIPIFISEFSLCDASGSGSIDYDSSDAWFELIDKYNLSYASWSLCNKDETASLIKSSCTDTKNFTDSDLTETGVYVKSKISGK
jgi:endoglucanase